MKNLLYSCFFIVLVFSGKETIAQSGKTPTIRAIESLNPVFWVYHKNSQTTQLFFKTNSRELVYNRRETADFTASISISYRVWTIDDIKQVVDTGTVHLMDVNNEQKLKEITGTIELRLPEGKNYKLKVDFSDKKRNATSSTTFYVYKKDRINRQNFLVTNPKNNKIFLSPYLNETKIRVQSRMNAGLKMQVRVYNREFTLAPPPFAEPKIQQFKYEADSIYYLSLNDTGVVDLSLPKIGFIHLVLDTSKHEGVTLFSVSKYFPRLAAAEDLVDPLRFLCSSDEFKALKSAQDKKAVIDRFWLDKAGTNDKGRELIRGYYSRAEYANKNFSSYTEGWKTDRGMIYLIFGEPSAIDRTEDNETWIYGDRFNSTSLRFNFIKVENPFSANDYYLQRLITYKPEWYRAVDTWRLGKIYKFIN